ncbi:MAG: hypothetical protein KAT70_04765, partial [Thermoplasmata archaeon]|nr:hypothetical protein [Thermoplasmata archaeon]
GYGGGIAEGWLALWRGTLGIDMNIEFDYISDQSPAERIEAAKDLEKMLDEAERTFSPFWSSLG